MKVQDFLKLFAYVAGFLAFALFCFPLMCEQANGLMEGGVVAVVSLIITAVLGCLAHYEVRRLIQKRRREKRYAQKRTVDEQAHMHELKMANFHMFAEQASHWSTTDAFWSDFREEAQALDAEANTFRFYRFRIRDCVRCLETAFDTALDREHEINVAK